MTSIQQRAALQRQIWQIANDVRGSVDGWDFKQYVLGTLFYRFISENFAAYIEAEDADIHYAQLADSVITPEIKDDAIKTKGYFIYPSQLYAKILATANTNESLNTDLAAIFSAIESSANGYPSEKDIKGLFADFDTTSNRLGNTVKDKNLRLAAVLTRVGEMDFGDFEGSQIDLFGDAYEFLISNYAANAGKSGGEFFTPQHVSRLIAQLAMHKQTSVNKIYDPAAGSGSLLLQAKKHFDAHVIEDGFFGQEINHTTYNLARMNMSLHNINYDKFNIQPGNTLTYPHFFGTTIAVNILVLSKHKPGTRTRFIDASGLFKKETNNNVLTDAHSESIMEVFDTRENVPHFAATVDHATVAGKDYNLSVSTYVEAKDTREVVDIGQLNAELASTVAKIDRLRTDIDAIVAEIEGEEVGT